MKKQIKTLVLSSILIVGCFAGASLLAAKDTAAHESSSSAPLVVDQHNFTDEVENSSLPVVVDVYADWCGPCRMLAPILEELSAEMGESYKFAKLNADKNRSIAERYGVMGLPTLLFIKDGKEVGRLIGLTSKEDVKQKIEENLG